MKESASDVLKAECTRSSLAAPGRVADVKRQISLGMTTEYLRTSSYNQVDLPNGKTFSFALHPSVSRPRSKKAVYTSTEGGRTGSSEHRYRNHIE